MASAAEMEWPAEITERVARTLATCVIEDDKDWYEWLVEAAFALDAMGRILPGGRPALLALLSGEAVVVPKDPTDEMESRGIFSLGDTHGETSGVVVSEIYGSMLASSPYAPPAATGSG